jgi:hypothetical protein
MARMTREFSLVLLGAGILTAGSFLWPEEDLDKRAETLAGQQVASSNAHGTRRGYVPMFIYLHSARSGFSSSPTRAPVARGGFGGMGRSISGVS